MYIKEADSRSIQNSIKKAVYTISNTLSIDAREATRLFYSTKTSDELLNPLTKMWQEDYTHIAKLALSEITSSQKEIFRETKAELLEHKLIFKKIAYI